MQTISAPEILRPNDVSKETLLQSTTYNTPVRLLRTRTLDRLTRDILYKIHADHTQHPNELLPHLDTVYSVFPAEKRLLLVKTRLNFKPNGNTITMMWQWQCINTKIEQEYVVSGLCHDVGIVLLGDFQHSFVHAQLDNIVTPSKRDSFHWI